MLLEDVEVVLQIAIATGCNKKTVAFFLHQEKIGMFEDEPRHVEKSNRRECK